MTDPTGVSVKKPQRRVWKENSKRKERKTWRECFTRATMKAYGDDVTTIRVGSREYEILGIQGDVEYARDRHMVIWYRFVWDPQNDPNSWKIAAR